MKNNENNERNALPKISVERMLRAASHATKDAALLQSARVHAALESIRIHLETLPLQTLQRWLELERPAVVASLLCFGDAKRGGEILARFSDARQLEVLQNLANPRQVRPEELETLALELHNLFRVSNGPLLSRGGEERAAQLLAGLSLAHRERILTELESRNAALYGRLKQQLLTLEQVSQLLPRDLAFVCSLFSNLDVALVLRSEKEGVRQRFLAGVSQGRRVEIEELLDVGKPQFKAKVEEAQARLLQKVGQLKQEGDIFFPWEQDVV